MNGKKSENTDQPSSPVISTPDGDIDPTEHQTAAQFKSAVYDSTGPGSWLDDMILQTLWLDTHGKPIPEEMQPLIKNHKK